MRLVLSILGALLLFAGVARAQVDEIVANLAGGRVIIQVTRDGIVFAAIDHPLEIKSVPPRLMDLDATHVNLNDGTLEGMHHRRLRLFSVQYHPEASAGPHDSTYLFEEFRSLVG